MDDPASLLDRLAGQADAAEVFSQRVRCTQLGFRGGGLHMVQEADDLSTTARVIVDRRVGMSSTTNPAGHERLCRAALEAAHFGDHVELQFPGPAPTTAAAPLGVYDPATADASLAELAALGNAVVDRVRAACPQGAIELQVERSVISWSVQNTSGLRHDCEETVARMVVDCTLSEADDVFPCSEAISARNLGEVSEVAERLITKLRWGARRVAPPCGRLPVVFLPTGARILLEPLLAATTGARAVARSSPLVGREGERILDPRIDITLDPSRPHGPDSLELDHEGTPARAWRLVADGVFSAFYHDLTTAARAGAMSTGNARRSRLTGPMPRPGNVVVRSGDSTFQQMLDGIEDGLLLESVLGGGQGGLLSGGFSNTIGVAYRICKGEVAGRVCDVSIAGNVYELLGSRLHSLSSTALATRGSVVAPEIRVEDVNLVA